ncbi:MAG: tetraacyldisaccharide 4'-kinase [Campylobacterota bacterium]|nr:tetraacyldisaccharide 4'-kinase [Campylobacterota bacterium]
MKRFFVRWLEQYLFFPTPIQRLIGILLLPLTLIYCVVTTYLRVSKKTFDMGIPVISVGNLLVGGTGKTPVTIALAKDKKESAVILRGYGRESKGLFVISNRGKILEDVTVSGDEAMLLARSLPNSVVIVSENRIEGILKAKELECKVVFLDDGFNKHEIKKYDILIRPQKEPENIFCLPTGGYRDTKMMYSFVPCVLKEGSDFNRVVTFKKEEEVVETLPKKLLLLTAISKPQRLLEYLPNDIIMEDYPDHHNFSKEDIEYIKNKYEGYSIITTAKDMVKLETYDLKDLYLMDLEVKINDDALKGVEKYIAG